MLTISNSERYHKHLQAREGVSRYVSGDFWLLLLVFASMGAITWAIRGSSGWGGVDGTVLPGLMWGLLWYYYCYRIGIDASPIVFWLGMGIALGGELGYGQYTAWILGKFYAGDQVIAIEPWIGYLWFMICGIGWAAPGGILLGWALGEKRSTNQWIIRSSLVLVLLIILFAWPLVEWVALQFARLWPALLFPQADLGIYSGTLDGHLQRTIYTNTQNFLVLVWWAAALVLAVLQKDRWTLVSGLLIGGGFGFGFMQSAAWCLGYGTAPDYIDWWKLWELNAGFNLGILYTLLMFWAVRDLDRQYKKQNDTVQDTEKVAKNGSLIIRRESLFIGGSGAVLLFFMGFEYFFWTAVFLMVLYFVAILYSGRGISDPNDARVRRDQMMLAFSTFLLLFLMFHGGSERAGILLGLYAPEAVDQYAWPLQRIILFLPLAILLVGSFVYWIRPVYHQTMSWPLLKKQSVRMIDLMTLIGFIGALSIWPAKIGVIYAFFIFLALAAFNRLYRKIDMLNKP